jgi:UDP-2-acetamido-2,6-beta-L-arabino-hexul-4-ose reductase
MSTTKKIKVGITGQSGFLGTHLYNELGLFPEQFDRVHFKKSYFNDLSLLANFVEKCDVIVHLAAVNRSTDDDKLYNINVGLVHNLIDVAIQKNVKPHIIFSSSTQEKYDNPYGQSKLEGRRLFEIWAKKYDASFTGIIIPNIYGPFGKPNYNSFIATFCQKFINNEQPVIITDNDVNLIYVSSLCKYIITDICDVNTAHYPILKEKFIQSDCIKKVSEVLTLLNLFKEQYLNQGIIPPLRDKHEINLFNTFRSYINLEKYFPYVLKKNTDVRGMFVETIRSGVGGQVSFSITKPGITRGNHFHIRKVERFIVTKGQAKIKLRRIGTHKTVEFILDGANPSFVDMPIWYTHNITNIGTDDLYTQFWINEWYDKMDSDTFFESV